MTDPEQTPAEALETIRKSREAVGAAVSQSSRKYDLIYSTIAALMVAGQVLPMPLNIFASTGGAVAFALLARKWADKTGVFVNGMSPKRARWVAFGLGGIFVVLMLAAMWFGRTDRAWLGIPLGLAAFVLAWAGSRLWGRVFRAETRDLK